MSNELRLDQVSKRFGGLRVFEHVSFVMSPRDVLGVIGPNGAGKTTLINVVCGAMAPTSGAIFLDGRDITGQSLHTLSRHGLVRSFQQTNTFRSASVRENLSRAIRFSGGGRPAWEGIGDLLDRFELAPRLNEQSDKLPYGLQKMLGLLMAYATRPKVLLLDEPAAGLERKERTRVDELVGHARATLGCSVLIVEHDMDLVRRLCPRLIVLDAGAVLASGPTGEVLARREVIDAYVGVSEEDGEGVARAADR